MKSRDKAKTAYQVYWSAYGGIHELVTSMYLVASLIFTILTPKTWLVVGEDLKFSWTSTALSVTPSMLGFTLGAMAILLSLSGKTFLRLAQKGGEKSFYMKAISTFFHFIVVQITSVMTALATDAWPEVWVSFLGYFCFIYAIACGLASAAALLDLAQVKMETDTFDAESEDGD